MTLGGVKWAKVMISFVDRDYGTIACFKEAIGGRTDGPVRMRYSEAKPRRYMYRLGQILFSALPAAGRDPKYRMRRILLQP